MGKVWDLRTYQPVCQYSVGAGASQLQWSQRGLLATSFGNRVEVYKDPTMQDKVEERNKKLFVKPSNIEFDPRAKMKGKGGSATRHHIRRTVIEQARKRGLKDDLEARMGRREG